MAKVGVVGAGPAGLTLSLLLAKQGFQVKVLDKRPAPDVKGPTVDQRTILYGIMPRGLQALKQAELRLPGKDEKEVSGLRKFSHLRPACSDGKGHMTDPLVKWPGDLLIIERAALVQKLAAKAQDSYPDLIDLIFEANISKVDIPAKQLNYTDSKGKAHAEKFDLIVGADGAKSIVRQAMQDNNKDMKVDIIPAPSAYVSFGGLEPQKGWEMEGDEGAHALMAYCLTPYNRLTLWRSTADTIIGVFFSTPDQWAKLTETGGHEAHLRRIFPNVPEKWFPQIAAQLKGVRPSASGATIRCSTIVAPGTVIIGDAAHAVRPTMGQGSNAALESAYLLSEAIEKCQGSLDTALQRYNAQRLPDLHALYNLDMTATARAGFGTARKLNPHCLVARFHTLLWGSLSSLLPGRLPPPELSRMATDCLRYKEAWWALQRDGGLALLSVLALALMVNNLTQHMPVVIR